MGEQLNRSTVVIALLAAQGSCGRSTPAPEPAVDAGAVDATASDIAIANAVDGAPADTALPGMVGVVTDCDLATRGIPAASFGLPTYDPDGDGGFAPLKVNVWAPDRTIFPGKRPGILMIHGGCGCGSSDNCGDRVDGGCIGASGGDEGGGCYSIFGTPKKEADGSFFAGRGYLAVAVQFRYPFNHAEPEGSPAAKDDLGSIQHGLQDLRCALRWMRQATVAGLDQLDDEHVIAYGGSGGGGYSLQLLSEANDGVDPWWDNPLCPYNALPRLPSGRDTASIQGAVTGFPHLEDRPQYLDLTPPRGTGLGNRWPPKDPDDWLAADGSPARSNYYTASLTCTLDHLFGADDFPSKYGQPGWERTTDLVDHVAILTKVRADFPPLFVTHSVWDDLNYYEGTRDLRAALLAAGYPPEGLTVVPVSRAVCTAPGTSSAALNDTILCAGHDFDMFTIDRANDDPRDSAGMDLNHDGEPDYDAFTSFCTMLRFMEVHWPP